MVQRNIVKRVILMPESKGETGEPQKDELEELTFDAKRRLTDYLGRDINASPIGEPTFLKYKHVFTPNINEIIANQALEGVDAYTLSKEIESLRNSDYVVRIIQYRKISGRRNTRPLKDLDPNKFELDKKADEKSDFSDISDWCFGYDLYSSFFS